MNLSELLQNNNTTYDLLNIVINFTVSFVLSWIIFIVYRITYKGVAYSKNFNITIILTTLITAMVMMVIGNNLALSLGMVGALSIVRFRAAIKEPKDIAFIFWGIAVGLAAGTGAYSIAVIGTILIAIVAILFTLNLGGETKTFILIIKGDALERSDVDALVKSNCKHAKIRMSSIKELVYEVNLGKTSENELIDALQKLDTVSLANLISYNGQITG